MNTPDSLLGRLAARHATLVLVICFGIQSLVSASASKAGSATWDQNPTSNDWNTSANWTPQTIPDQTSDVATFGPSAITTVSGSDYVFISGVTFNSGASAYTLSGDFYFQGQGTINNSGVMQNITGVPGLGFANNATAGDNVTYTLYADVIEDDFGAAFNDKSNAGSSTFLNHGQRAGDIAGSAISFGSDASAADSTIVNYGPEGGAYGASTFFRKSATASSSNITAYAGAAIDFEDNTSAADSTLIADGGDIEFEGQSDGGLAQVTLIDGGMLSVSGHTSLTFTIGSLAGDGMVNVANELTAIGSNNLSTNFSGVINESGTRGHSITKIGTGTLTLSGLNSYTGGTTIAEGSLLVNNPHGSALGSGPVQVDAGTFGGRSNIAGAVTVGSGSGSGAYLAPGINGPGVLTIKNSLTFQADGVYQCDLNLKQSKADEVTCKSVSIAAGAQFMLQPKGKQTLAAGTVFTVVNNAGKRPINGAFVNLPDGGTITAGPNTLQANYQGGNGNDLTLTVVP